MTFETAIGHLRRGKAVRRRVWHVESAIFRIGPRVYVKLPGSFGEAQERPGHGNLYESRPDFWKPYPTDVLANDWEIAR